MCQANFSARKLEEQNLKSSVGGSGSLGDMEFDDSVLNKRLNNMVITTDADDRQALTFHCQQCNTVLGDSFSVCGEVERLDSIMCLKVTSDVIVGDAEEPGHKGELDNSIYSSLTCRTCQRSVGRIVHAAPSHLASVRNIFLLSKENISCYILNSSSMVKASTLSFHLKPLKEKMDEMRRQFDEKLNQMSHIRSRVANRSKRGSLVLSALSWKGSSSIQQLLNIHLFGKFNSKPLRSLKIKRVIFCLAVIFGFRIK
nr:protein Mis18-beta [Nothobranchius furzeri]